jgi:hypothetical protein
MKRLAALFYGGLAVTSVHAQSLDLPRYEVNTACLRFPGATKQHQCVLDAQNAYDFLKNIWTSYEPIKQKTCLLVARGVPHHLGYATISKCLISRYGPAHRSVPRFEH